MRRASLVSLLAVSTLALACNGSQATTTTTKASATPATAAPREATATTGRAAIGQAAPDFTLKDLDGHDVRLSSFKGKTVVLEWFNPACPFVRRSHDKGSLKGAAERHAAKGVVWLAINSAAPGKQGHGVDTNRTAVDHMSLKHPVLLDETGDVGRAYGATNTPHMFVVDAAGRLAYRGAIDNSPDGEGQSPENGTLVSYVDAALGELASGKPVSRAETTAYGCSVKYAH